MSKIHIILPYREGFGSSHFGAVALCVRDFTLHSKFRDNITIFGGVDVEPFEDMPYQYVPVKKSLLSSGNKDYASSIIHLINNEKPDLVEVHNRPNLAHYIREHWTGKLALHIHNDPLTIRGAGSVKEREKLIQKCDAIYCVSGFIKDQFCKGLRVNSDNVHVAYNGFSIPNEQPKDKEKHLLFIGRLQPEKGSLEFAQALQKVLPHHPEWKAIFIGASRHQHEPEAKMSAYEQQLNNTVKPLGNQVELRGYCPHKQTLAALAEAAILVVPSQCNEAFGCAALEGMAHGCAILSTIRGGLKEVIGNAGHLMENATVEAIAEGLNRLINDEEYREHLQKLSFIQAQNFDIKKTTHALDNIRENLLNQEALIEA